MKVAWRTAAVVIGCAVAATLGALPAGAAKAVAGETTATLVLPPSGCGVLTLLDEAARADWPPLACLDRAGRQLDAPALLRADLLDWNAAPLARDARPGGKTPPGAGLNYDISDRWRAGVTYQHARLFELGSSAALRDSGGTGLLTDRDRDVLNLQMSWHLAESELGLGYRLESARLTGNARDTLSLGRLSPDGEHNLHSLMFGITRRWGGASP